MTHDLMSVVLDNPALWSLPLFAIAYALGMAFAMNDRTRELLADVRLAMKRADLSVDYVARVCGVPPNKASDQLRGVSPFTALWRLFSAPEICGSAFEAELLTLRAERKDRTVVRADVGVVLEQSVLLVERSHQLLEKSHVVLDRMHDALNARTPIASFDLEVEKAS